MANVHLARCPRHHLALLADGIKKKQFKKYAQCVLLTMEAKFNQDWEDFVAFDPTFILEV